MGGYTQRLIAAAEKRVRSVRPRTAERRVVVVGNGMVSYGLCQALTANQARHPHVTVFGEERYPAYDRIHLSEIHAPERALLAPASWYQTRGIDLRLGQRVIRIDRERQQVLLESGERCPFDVLVLATGSEPLLPRIAGIHHPCVFSYRTIEDVQRIRAALDVAGAAVIVGGGLLGLEAARLALDAGCDTKVVETSRMLMPKQLDPSSAEVLRSRVQALGVEVLLGKRLTAIEDADGRVRLRFDSGETLEAGVVVVATGVQPRDQLAREAGLSVGARGGVVVDDQMRSSDPGIYAIGDCACHRGRNYGLISPGLAMAEVAASAIFGGRVRFGGGDPSCELKLMGIPVAAIGDYQQNSLSLSASVVHGRRTLLLDSGRLVGAIAVGPWTELPRVRGLIDRRRRLPRRLLRNFEQTGSLYSHESAAIVSWPADALVCNCKRVTKGTLEQCLQSCGADTEALTARTGAGSVCGSCKPLLLELVGQTLTHVRVPYARALARISWVAAALVLGLCSVPALKWASSAQGWLYEIDKFRYDSLFRQVSGFSILGFAVLSLVVSLRKRTRLLSRIPIGGARALHALMTVLALLALYVHTGLRMGSQLNYALMVCFAGVSLAGALAGGAAAAESAEDPRWARRGRTLRNPSVKVHTLLLWPLPTLIALHVFAAYYF